MSIPILSRLEWKDYERLLYTVIFLLVEKMLRMIFYFIPVALLDFVRFRLFG